MSETPRRWWAWANFGSGWTMQHEQPTGFDALEVMPVSEHLEALRELEGELKMFRADRALTEDESVRCTCWRNARELTMSAEADCPEHGRGSALSKLSDEQLLNLQVRVRDEIRRRDPGPPDAEVAEYSVLDAAARAALDGER